MRAAPFAALAFVAALAAPALAQTPADSVRPGMIVRSDVDRTLGRVERIDTRPDGRKVLVVVSYDQPPLRRAVPASRVVEVQGSAVRVDFGRQQFDSLPSAN